MKECRSDGVDVQESQLPSKENYQRLNSQKSVSSSDFQMKELKSYRMCSASKMDPSSVYLTRIILASAGRQEKIWKVGKKEGKKNFFFR